MTPYEAYLYALDNYIKHDFYLNYYQEIACRSARDAYLFAGNIPGANINYCQEHACTIPSCAIVFAMFIKDADINYCQEFACKTPECAYKFATHIPGADIEYCRKACGHDEYWLNEFDKMIIEKVML